MSLHPLPIIGVIAAFTSIFRHLGASGCGIYSGIIHFKIMGKGGIVCSRFVVGALARKLALKCLLRTHYEAMIAPKFSLKDLFYPQPRDESQKLVYRNKIDRKLVDLLLYDHQTLRPLLGIELDDKSHQRKDRQDRDRFVDGVFSAS